jgi:hypothetical protein
VKPMNQAVMSATSIALRWRARKGPMTQSPLSLKVYAQRGQVTYVRSSTSCQGVRDNSFQSRIEAVSRLTRAPTEENTFPHFGHLHVPMMLATAAA